MSLVQALLLLSLLVAPPYSTAFVVPRHSLFLETATSSITTTTTTARLKYQPHPQGAFDSSRRSSVVDVSLSAKPRNTKNQVELGSARKPSSPSSLKTDKSSRNQGSSSSSSSSSSSKNSNWQKSSYNDDAFGLVFLGGGLVAQDVLFSGLFLVLSTMAAIATNLKSGFFPGNNPRLAGSVAGVTLVVRLILLVWHVTLPPLSPVLGAGSDITASTIWSEVALCSVSMLYGFVIAKAAPSSWSKERED
jgi:hypothetical protein